MPPCIMGTGWNILDASDMGCSCEVRRTMAKALIIDDDELICEMLSLMVEDMGHSASYKLTIGEGFKAASSEPFDVIFLDIRMPDGNGLDLLPRIHELPSQPEVIIITGLGDPDGAEIAIKNGAWDYIEKSSSTKEMALPFTRALQYREEKTAKKPLTALKSNGIIGSSARMHACLDLLAQAAHSEVNVLITGETGTGKEVFAGPYTTTAGGPGTTLSSSTARLCLRPSWRASFSAMRKGPSRVLTSPRMG